MNAPIIGETFTTQASGVTGTVQEVIKNATGSFRVRLDVNGADRWTTVKQSSLWGQVERNLPTPTTSIGFAIHNESLQQRQPRCTLSPNVGGSPYNQIVTIPPRERKYNGKKHQRKGSYLVAHSAD